MSTSSFTAPSLEEMNKLMPAFEFESELSANEVGAVYYARQKTMDRHVAVKVFSEVKGSDERFMASLKRATNLVGGLKHPNLIGVIDSGLAVGMPFIVMEFVPGKSLHRSTHGVTIDFNLSLTLIKELCEGMAYAHSNKVIHGNLSPLNILLNREATPKIGNFALGRGIHTLSGVEVPSHFSAPEVLAGEAHTEACDVYSLGAIFYELITAIPYCPGAPAASEIEGSPKAVDAVIIRATAQNPKERHAGPMEFYNALKKAAFNEPESEVQAATKVASPPAEPQAEPQAEPSARSKAVEMAMSTSTTGILVKLAIILVLLIAIHQVWNFRKVLMESRGLTSSGDKQSEGSSIESFEMTRSQRQAIQRQQEAQQAFTDGFPDDPETPMESLERLRPALAARTFGELPIGTLSLGGSHYFLVEQAMSWEEAAAHAESLGGNIAMPDGDMAWKEKAPFQGRSTWLGVARSGTDAFTTLQSEPWQPQTTIAGSGRFVHLDESGAFAAAPASTTLPYVIQWTEGATPMSFEERLAASAASMNSGQPVYPPGTIVSGQRRYLPVLRTVSWEDAGKLANSAGGHLYAISGEREASELGTWSARLATGTTYWMGGHLIDERWQWMSGEPWRAIDWISVSNAATDGVAMILRAGTGIDATAKSGTADGCIIEWSEDPASNKPQAGQKLPVLTTPGELTTVAQQLVTKAITDKEAAHTKNTEKLAWDLNSHLRSLNKSDREEWSPEADKLRECVQNNRLLKETIESSGAVLSPFMSKLCDYLIRKQGEIDEQHQKSLQAIHASYLGKLGEIRDEAKARGQVKAQLAADELIKSSQNLEGWVARMSVVTE